MQLPAGNQVSSHSNRAFGDILAVQRSAGNRATVSLLLRSGGSTTPAIQAKLRIGPSGDSYEQEADRVADQVMQGSHEGSILSAGPQNVQRACAACSNGGGKCPRCEEEEIQRKPFSSTTTPFIQRAIDAETQGNNADARSDSSAGRNFDAGPVSNGAAGLIQSQRNGGERLADSARAFFESRLRYDFSQVRTHTGPEAEEAARAVNARAFTIGRDVFFGAGEYSPETSEGQRLLAHELTHVVQQTSSSSHRTSTIQRQVASTAPTPRTASGKEAKAAGMIADDNAIDLQPGQMKKAVFLAELRTKICRAAEAILAETGRTTKDCPYLDFWFSFYGQKDSRHIERAVHKYAPEASGATSAKQYIPPIVNRVSRSVAVWAKTGKITGIPEGLLADSGLAVSSDSDGNSGRSTGSIQFKAHNGGARAGGDPQAIKTQLGSGRPLDGGVRSRMESAYGRSFSHVRVHTDVAAASLSDSLNARAFTVGEHIAFGSSEYRPGSLIGDAIIAHELAHVMQQGSADRDIDPTQMGQGSYAQFEEDADQSAVAAGISLWGRAKGVLNVIRQAIKPRLTSGLQLQACRRTVKECPKGLRWAVVGQPTATGPVCVCAWRCLPPGVGFSLPSASSGPQQSTITCRPPERGPNPCPRPPSREIVDEDYEITREGEPEEDQGTVVGVGAHMSPLGGQAACGCLPLDIEGDPTGEKKVHAPLLAPGLDITDLAGMKGRSRKTGEIQPGKRTTETKPTVKPTETETGKTTVKPTETETGKTTVKPTETTGTKPTVAADKLSELKSQRSSKQAELQKLQEQTSALEKKREQAETDRQAASREYDKATTREAKDAAVAKMREAKGRRDKATADLEKLPSDDSLKREVKKLDSQIEAETPKPAPKAQGGRDPLDIEVEKKNPKPPPAKSTGKIGESAAQDAEMQ
ncbi:MAG TPA: DUF4157 domain-containing protein, partial [Blastocatellia bacterium]|nr:DUF4157 domain-containing protein [Blastocatellia bacterium]